MTMNPTFRRRLRRGALCISGGLAATLVLAACSAPAEEATGAGSAGSAAAQTEGTAPTSFLTEYALDGLDATQIIDQLEAAPLADRPTGLIASIRPDELLLTDEAGNEATLAMPEDRFYLSVAPYVTQTHECYFHSLTTCTGEMSGAELDITVTDATTGEVILSETRSTEANGFVGLWLPRGIQANLTISYEGRSATTPISTATDADPTCLTTVQLPQA